MTRGIQESPCVIRGFPDPVVKLVAGAQHVFALTSAGSVFSWGCPEQYQLGRRRLDSTHELQPAPIALPSGAVVDIGAGQYHSFAIHKRGGVYAWGSNNYGQTGIAAGAGTNDATVMYPTLVKSFKKHPRVTFITGGKDHSLAITEAKDLLTWGRIDNKALGLHMKKLPLDDILVDRNGKPRILTAPHHVLEVDGLTEFVAAGTDHSFVITSDGDAYSWGFNAQHQAGQPSGDEIEHIRRLESKDLMGKYVVSAAGGGQFSILAGKHLPIVNLAAP